MSGLPLAFGVLAGLAVAGAVRQGSRSVVPNPSPLVPVSGDWAAKFQRGEKETFWTVPRLADRVRILRNITVHPGLGVFVTWGVFGNLHRGVELVGLLSGNEVAPADNLCATALDALRRETGAPIRGLLHVSSVKLDASFQKLGLARDLYRDLVAVAAEHGLAAAPGACYRDAAFPHLGRGSTKPVAQRIWEDLSHEYPHAKARTRFVLWGGAAKGSVNVVLDAAHQALLERLVTQPPKGWRQGFGIRWEPRSLSVDLRGTSLDGIVRADGMSTLVWADEAQVARVLEALLAQGVLVLRHAGRRPDDRIYAWAASAGSASVLPDLSVSTLSVGQRVNLQAPYTVTGREGVQVRFDPVDGLGNVPDNANVDYLGFVVWMPISLFLGLNPPLMNAGERVKALATRLRAGDAFGPPFLIVDALDPEGLKLGADWEHDGSRVIGSFRVRNHEGRHRMAALRSILGDVSVPVQVFGSRSWRTRDFTGQALRGVTIRPDVRVPAIRATSIHWFALDGIVGR